MQGWNSDVPQSSYPVVGKATEMLGASLGIGGQNGGLNTLYQIGGPRSAQLALNFGSAGTLRNSAFG